MSTVPGAMVPSSPSRNPFGSGSLLTAAEANDLLSRGDAILIDVREPMEHARERIEGARLIPLGRIRAADLAEAPGKAIILHCQSGRRSDEAARMLLESRGLHASQIEGGIEGWRRHGLATRVNTKAPIPIMRQVQMVAGGLVAIGVALGVFVDPWFLFLPAFVGCGLFFAGASGWCGMAMLLGRMPWNRVPKEPGRVRED